MAYVAANPMTIADKVGTTLLSALGLDGVRNITRLELIVDWNDGDIPRLVIERVILDDAEAKRLAVALGQEFKVGDTVKEVRHVTWKRAK